LNHDRTQNHIQKLPTNQAVLTGINKGQALLPAPASTEDITPTVFAVLFIGGLIAAWLRYGLPVTAYQLAVAILYLLALFYFKG